LKQRIGCSHNPERCRDVFEFIRRLPRVILNARDSEPFSRLFTVDHDFRNYGRRHDRSRDALRSRYAQAWLNTPPGVRHKTSVDTVRSLGPGVALVDGEVLVGVPNAPEGETRRYYYAAVVVLRDGEWLFDAFRVTPQQIPPC
jgi:uncharacterized protein (TIGR02246 family)